MLKDNIPSEEKSGIYQINCKDCEKYVGKTKRDLETRVKEPIRNIKKWRTRKISNSSTCMERKPVLLKQASNKLAKYPYNKDRIINFEILPANHLIKFILKPVKVSRSAPTRITKPTPVDNEDKVLESAPHILK